MAIYRLYAIVNRARLPLATQRVTTVEVNLQLAIEIGCLRNGAVTNEADQEAVMVAIVRVRATVTQKTVLVEIPRTSSELAALRALDEKAANEMMASPRWVRGMSIVALITAGFAVRDMFTNGANVGNVVTAISGVATSALGLATLAGLGETFAVRLGGAALAGAAAGVSVWQWSEDAKAGRDTTGDILGTAGGTALLFSSAVTLLELSVVPEPLSPLLALVGGVLLMASIAYSLSHDDAVRDAFRNSVKRWFVCQVRSYQQGKRFAAHRELMANAKALENAIISADFFFASTKQRDSLAHLVDPSEVNMFFDEVQ